MFKWAIDLDFRWTVPTISFLTAMAGFFVSGALHFDHLMPASWIPTALSICDVLVVGGPLLTGGHMIAATYSPRLETPPK